MKILWGLAGLCLISHFSSQALASTELDGFVCQTSNKLPGIRQFKTTAPCDPVEFTDSVSKDDYRSLRTDDWVSFFGTVYGVPVKVEIESIQMVGLNRLIGKWNDGGDRVFRFYSYNSLTISTKAPNKSFRDIDYELYPNSRNLWLVLMIEKNKVSSGTLRYSVENKKSKLEFCFDEPKSANAECVILQR